MRLHRGTQQNAEKVITRPVKCEVSKLASVFVDIERKRQNRDSVILRRLQVISSRTDYVNKIFLV